MQKTLIILGSGYTARFLLPLATRHYATVLATSRDPGKHLTCLDPAQRLRFDLAQPHTWAAIPDNADLLWCFPAAPLNLVRQCGETLNAARRRLVVLGSTSAYEVGHPVAYPPSWIDETAPIDLSKPRVKGEEFLRTECGAILLRVAGIYGPGRNPLDWIKTGRVGPSRKYVNLIHVKDLASICLAALERGTSGEAYNVSDGTPRTWREICTVMTQDDHLTAPTPESNEQPGKRISTHKLVATFGSVICHQDLYTELAQLVRS